MAALFVAVVAVGCRSDPATLPMRPSPDGGITADATVPDPRLDSDGDGLCDGTERVRRTDPFLPDTDSDGLPDRVEIDLGTMPTRGGSPSRESLVLLTERTTAEQRLPIAHVVRGDGENFSGAFEWRPAVDEAGPSAFDFYLGSTATHAVPMQNVAFIEPDEERFYNVVGETRLIYEVRLSFGANRPQDCTRVYPFGYPIKGSDGRLVYHGRFFLIVLPAGQRFETAEWCEPVGGCI